MRGREGKGKEGLAPQCEIVNTPLTESRGCSVEVVAFTHMHYTHNTLGLPPMRRITFDYEIHHASTRN